jgi:hypothetical protein
LFTKIINIDQWHQNGRPLDWLGTPAPHVILAISARGENKEALTAAKQFYSLTKKVEVYIVGAEDTSDWTEEMLRERAGIPESGPPDDYVFLECL